MAERTRSCRDRRHAASCVELVANGLWDHVLATWFDVTGTGNTLRPDLFLPVAVALDVEPRSAALDLAPSVSPLLLIPLIRFHSHSPLGSVPGALTCRR